MPLEQTELSEEEKKKQLEQQSNSFGGQTIGAGAGAEIQPSTLGTAPGSSRLSPVTPQTPTQSFGTIQDYFKGSREQGERFGEQFTGKLAETQQQQRGEIGQAATGALQDISAGTVGYDPGLVSRAATDPTKVTGDEGQFEDFLSQWNAQYRGPQTFEGATQYGAAAQAAKTAADKAAQTETTGGRQQLIQDEFGVYGRGKKGLDEALLQQSSSFAGLGEQAKGLRSLQDYLRSQSQDIGTQAQRAKETTEAAKQQTRGTFKGKLTDFQKDLNERVAAQQKATAELKQQQTNLTSGDLVRIQADLKKAGVDPATVQDILRNTLDLKRYYGKDPQVSKDVFSDLGVAIDPSTVASQEDYEKAQAYQKLTGRDYSGVLNPADIEKAGTAALAESAYKPEALQDYLKQSLTTQSKELLTKPAPNLKTAISNPASAHQGKILADKYIDAYTRRGDRPRTFDELEGPLKDIVQQISDPIMTARMTAARNGADLSDPNIVQRPEFNSVRAFLQIQKQLQDWMNSQQYKFS